MKANIIILSFFVFVGLILGSCATSNQVGGGGMIQKRKYNKGFYWNRGGNFHNSKESNVSSTIIPEEEIVEKSEILTLNEEEIVPSEPNDRAEFENDASKEAVVLNSIFPNNVNSDVSQRLKGKNQIDPEYKRKNELGVKALRSKNVFISEKTKVPSQPHGEVALLVLIILAILIPPLAVILYEGPTARFWIDLILALIGWGVGFWLFGPIGGLFGLIAVIYALFIVLGLI